MRLTRIAFPTPYSVLMVVLALAAAATWLMPAGRYDTLIYDAGRQALVTTTAGGEHALPATQRTLDSLGIQISLDEFSRGAIRKPVSIPDTYHAVPPDRQGVVDVLMAPILGIQQAIDVILFVLVIGGFIAIFNRTGVFAAGIEFLAHRLRGRESWLIVVLTALMALGGTTYGLAEETLAFFPLLVPVFIAAGYDVMVPLAVIFVGAGVGFMASTTNPFAVIIASDAAGVSWTTGLTGRIVMWLALVTTSIIYINRYARRVRLNPALSLVKSKVGNGSDVATDTPALAVEVATQKSPRLSRRAHVLLGLFALTFVVMIVGVSRLGWWFNEMATLFFAVAMIAGLIERLGESELVRTFLKGAQELLGVAFIIGFARGVTILLERGEISGTVVYYASDLVQRMPGVGFVTALLVVYAILTIFISSSSGMAVLTMPIMGTLGGMAGVPREEIVNAFMYGMGIMGFLTPTGLVLPSLAMVNVSYGTWLKFVLPLLAWIALIAVVVLALGVLL